MRIGKVSSTALYGRLTVKLSHKALVTVTKEIDKNSKRGESLLPKISWQVNVADLLRQNSENCKSGCSIIVWPHSVKSHGFFQFWPSHSLRGLIFLLAIVTEKCSCCKRCLSKACRVFSSWPQLAALQPSVLWNISFFMPALPYFLTGQWCTYHGMHMHPSSLWSNVFQSQGPCPSNLILWENKSDLNQFGMFYTHFWKWALRHIKR